MTAGGEGYGSSPLPGLGLGAGRPLERDFGFSGDLDSYLPVDEGYEEARRAAHRQPIYTIGRSMFETSSIPEDWAQAALSRVR